MMEKRIICSVLLSALLISMCACSSDKYIIDDADEDTVGAVTTSVTDNNKSDITDKVSENTETNKVPATTETEAIVTNKADVETEAPQPDVTMLDPFAGLKVDFDGISPFCTIAFNNSKCSDDVQLYVEYSISDEKVTTTGKQFKINDEVTVYATLKKDAAKNGKFALAKTQQTYKVEKVPEYITEITADMDLSKLKAEMKDYFDSITAFTKGDSVFVKDGFYTVTNYASHTPIQCHESYFCTLKLHSYDKFNASNGWDYFNKINIMYSTVITDGFKKNHNVYFTVCAKNIVRYPDGTIKWGKTGPDTLAFEFFTNKQNMESLVNSNITARKVDFNVTTITGILP